MAKIITIGFENMDKMATVEAVLIGMGIKYTVKDAEVRTSEANEPKSDKKAENVAKPAKTRKVSKTSDNFDRELYLQCAEELGVLGKGGVYKFARQTVYDAMSEVGKAKSHKLTKAVKKSLMRQLLTEAQRLGLQWYIDKVAA